MSRTLRILPAVLLSLTLATPVAAKPARAMAKATSPSLGATLLEIVREVLGIDIPTDVTPTTTQTGTTGECGPTVDPDGCPSGSWQLKGVVGH